MEHHLQEVHNEKIEDVGIRQLIERNQRPASILWTECPFCKFVPDLADIREVSTGFSKEELASKKLVKHIGHHLQSTSTLALPWRDDLKDDASSELNESGKVDNRQASSQLDVSEVGGIDWDENTDLRTYELDLGSIPPTVDQRWNRDPADFQEVDHDDPVIQHLISNKTYFLELEHQFAPLDPGRIRILRLHPGQPGDPIRCDRLVASLQHPPAYKYLSYIWGDASERESITVASDSCMVTKNLAIALWAIRRQNLTLTIWVDALCINQEDVMERNSQVLLIPQIVQGASETIVWLGLSTEDSDFAMDFVGRYDEFITKGLEGSAILALKQALISLFTRPWWSRVWVVQEAILSKSVVAICGSSSTPFEKFVGLRNFQPSQESSRDFQSLIQPVADMPFGDVLWLWDQLNTEVLNGTATLLSIMIAIRRLHCADARDKVYAPLGLCRENGSSISVDYNKTYSQVYKEAMQLFLLNEDIFPLYIIEEHLPTQISDLPSWVIDWSIPPVPRTGFAFDGKGPRRAYRSGAFPGGFNQLLRIAEKPPDNEYFIFREGIQLDTISQVGEPFGLAGTNTATLELCCSQWWRLYRAGLNDVFLHDPRAQERFCRTLVANRLENFVEEPTKAFLQDFESWLESLHEIPSLPPDNTIDRLNGRLNALICRSCSSRKFAVTRRGYQTLVPEKAQSGDAIVVLVGGDVPFVMRPCGGDYILVGEAYVDGFMNGEALDNIEGSKVTQNFSIR